MRRSLLATITSSALLGTLYFSATLPSAANPRPLQSDVESRALDAALAQIIRHSDAGKNEHDRLLLVLNGWHDYKPHAKHVVVGDLLPYLDELQRLRKLPEYLFEIDSTYRRRALAQVYPRCTNFTTVERPVKLPTGDIRVTYRVNHFDYHLHGPASVTLHLMGGSWRIASEEEGTVSL